MRALLLLVMALTVASIAPAVAAPVNVVDIVREPRAYIDKRLTVSGVMAYGASASWAICPLPEHRANLPAATPEHPICIELRSKEDYSIFVEKYLGAVVSMKGLYWHRCLPEVREREPEVAREACKDSGLNGWLGVESVFIQGYSADQNLNGVRANAPQWGSYERNEVSLQSDEAAGIDAFVGAFLAAVRTKDTGALALLYPRETRGIARIGFRGPEANLYWRVLSPEMAVTNAGASRPGVGYRLYGGPYHYQLCFCRHNDCAGQWRVKTSDDFDRNVMSPILCHIIERKRGTWWLRE